MDVSLDTGEFRAGLPARTYPSAAAPSQDKRPGQALVLAEPPAPGGGEIERGEPRRMRFAIPALLVAGWGGLFAYCAAYLGEDLPFRPQPASVAAARRTEEPPRPVTLLPDVPDGPSRPPAEPAAANEGHPTVTAVPGMPVPAAPAAVPVPPPRAAQVAQPAEYVGVWGPTPAACGRPSRRRGYLPATITADRARAGRTVCSFHDGHRAGAGWLMAADCSDRGRRWTSQVRLVVDGDRLTWTSSRGSASYVRCSRRAG